jgi:hypothetical protein
VGQIADHGDHGGQAGAKRSLPTTRSKVAGRLQSVTATAVRSETCAAGESLPRLPPVAGRLLVLARSADRATAADRRSPRNHPSPSAPGDLRSGWVARSGDRAKTRGIGMSRPGFRCVTKRDLWERRTEKGRWWLSHHRMDDDRFARLEDPIVSQHGSPVGGGPRRQRPARVRSGVWPTKPLLGSSSAQQAGGAQEVIVITVRLPADAILLIDGNRTEATGAVRTFQTPLLAYEG